MLRAEVLVRRQASPNQGPCRQGSENKPGPTLTRLTDSVQIQTLQQVLSQGLHRRNWGLQHKSKAAEVLDPQQVTFSSFGPSAGIVTSLAPGLGMTQLHLSSTRALRSFCWQVRLA